MAAGGIFGDPVAIETQARVLILGTLAFSAVLETQPLGLILATEIADSTLATQPRQVVLESVRLA